MATTKKVARKKVVSKKATKKVAVLKAAKKKATKRTSKKTTKKGTKKAVKKAVKKQIQKTEERTHAQRTSFDEKLSTVEALHKNKPKTNVDSAPVPSKQRLRKPMLRDKLSLAIFTPVLFPANIDALAIQTARLGGLAFVILGGIFALNFSQYVWGSSTMLAQQGYTQTAAAICDSATMTTQEYMDCLQGVSSGGGGTTDTSTSGANTTSNSTTTDDTQVITGQGVQEPPATFAIDQDRTEPVSGDVTISIGVDIASRVEVYVSRETYTSQMYLGTATETSPDIWEFVWQTDKPSYPDGSYKIKAKVYNVYHATDPYAESDIEYIEVVNTQAQQATTTPDTTTIDLEPDATVTLLSSQPVDATALFEVEVEDADRVKFTAVEISSGSLNPIGEALETTTGSNLWQLEWDTAGFADGVYDVTAHIKNINSGDTYTGGVQRVKIEHPTDDVVNEVVDDTATDVVDDTVDAVVDDTATDVVDEPADPPTVVLRTNKANPVGGSVDLRVDTRNAKYVELYAIRDGSATEMYIGNAVRITPGVWLYVWATRSVPNADYEVFPKVTNNYGTYAGESIALTVENELFVSIDPQIQNDISDAVAEAATIEKETLQRDVPIKNTDATAATEDEIDESDMADEEVTDTKEERVQKLIDSFAERIDTELRRFASAYRSGDPNRIQAAHARMDNLEDEIAARAALEDNKDELIDEIDKRMDEIVTQYALAIEEVDELIAKRVEKDVFIDSDNDGITDYDELQIYKTNPLVADSDGDGFIDGAEVESGYDPTDAKREAAIAYESPKEKGVVRQDVLKVETVESVVEDTPVADTDGVDAQAVITGRGLPNSYVTVYIFSTPVVVTVKTDQDGAWRYRFDKKLEDGEHEVYVGVTDNAGKIVAKSEPFAFVKEAQAFSQVDAAVAGSAEIADVGESDSLLSQYMIYLILSISVVSIGLVLILLGLHLDSRSRRYPEVVNPESSIA